MRTEDKTKELLARLRTLSEKGVGGESKNAEELLFKLIEKYQIR